jgi:hypothetical protein
MDCCCATGENIKLGCDAGGAAGVVVKTVLGCGLYWNACTCTHDGHAHLNNDACCCGKPGALLAAMVALVITYAIIQQGILSIAGLKLHDG